MDRKVNRQGGKRDQLWLPSKYSKLLLCFSKHLAESIEYTNVVRPRLKPAPMPKDFPSSIATSTPSSRMNSSHCGSFEKPRRQEVRRSLHAPMNSDYELRRWSSGTKKKPTCNIYMYFCRHGKLPNTAKPFSTASYKHPVCKNPKHCPPLNVVCCVSSWK